MTTNYPIVWWPQEGTQEKAFYCPANEIFFGGTRGGGKTEVAAGRQIYGAYTYGQNWNGLMVRLKYKDFSKIRRRFDEMIRAGMPAKRVGGENQVNYIRFDNGANITLMSILHLSQVDSLQGEEFTEITIDEAPTIPFISQLVDRLKGCLRSAHGVPTCIFLTGNPGGPGAAQISATYIGMKDGGTAPMDEGEVHRIVSTNRDGTKVEFSRIFIRSELWDNKILIEKDPTYEARLRSMHNKALVEAWLGGKWDVYVGQAFTFINRHIIKPIPVPDYAPLFMTFDYGFGAPFSVGWWWVDNADRIYRFAEWYGWDGQTPNVGLRYTDRQVAKGIVKKEKELGIWGKPVFRLAGHDCFMKKPDYKGGGQGDSTYNEFVKYAQLLRTDGNPDNMHADLKLMQGDSDRERKIRQFRNRLEVPDDPDVLPQLVVYDTCTHFLRTVPFLCVDDLTQEDLEKGQEDHIFDDSCHICMARPIGPDMNKLAEEQAKLERERKMAKLDPASKAAALEMEKIREQIQDADDIFMG